MMMWRFGYGGGGKSDGIDTLELGAWRLDGDLIEGRLRGAAGRRDWDGGGLEGSG